MTIKEAIRRIRNYIGFLYGTKEPQEDICEAMNMAIAALREKEARENQKPLTIEELWKMHDEPVYVVPLGKSRKDKLWKEWCVMQDDTAYVPGIEYWSWKIADYGDLWIAYRHKPKENAE